MARRPPVTEPATVRLKRLLTIVPWLLSRPGISLADAAAGLGVSEQQLDEDLSLLWMCGYGSMPDELIDIQRRGGGIFIDNADVIARPLRLGMDEAATLLVGLRALADLPGVQSDALNRALAKLERAAGHAADAAARVEVGLRDDADPRLLVEIESAIRGRRRLHLSYVNATRDEVTERDVDPMRVTNRDGHWYLEGWCHRAKATRLFRLDRIQALDVLDVDGTPPAGVVRRDLSEGVFHAAAGDLRVVLQLAPHAAWVADYYPVSEVSDDGGAVTVTMVIADLAWLQRLIWRVGGGVVVLDPPWLARSLRDATARALTAYTDNPQ